MLYPDRRHPVLAPAFDLVSTITVIENDDLALTLGGRRKFSEIDPASFATLARAAGADEKSVSGWVEEQVERTMASWTDHANSLPFHPHERRIIEAHLRGFRLF